MSQPSTELSGAVLPIGCSIEEIDHRLFGSPEDRLDERHQGSGTPQIVSHYPNEHVTNSGVISPEAAVSKQRAGQIEALAQIDSNPTLAVIFCEVGGKVPDDVESYKRQIANHTNSLNGETKDVDGKTATVESKVVELTTGVDLETLAPKAGEIQHGLRTILVHCKNEQEAAERAAELNAAEWINTVLVLNPTGSDSGLKEILSCISYEKEVDGLKQMMAGRLERVQNFLSRILTGKRLYTQITPEAMVNMYEYASGSKVTEAIPGEIAVLGNGVIGKGVIQELRRRGHRVPRHRTLRTREQVTNYAQSLRGVHLTGVFSAVRANTEFIDLQEFSPPPGEAVNVIDASCARRTDGTIGGSVKLDTRGPRRHASSPVNGLGHETTSILVERTIAAKIAQGPEAQEPTPRKSRIYVSIGLLATQPSKEHETV
ncbi:MAG TPA: hypothetical protein VIS56_00410 [Candidatus Saccharimonadales bacterium]